jgi:4-hydroxy-tetrahydrodipicolinate reductase
MASGAPKRLGIWIHGSSGKMGREIQRAVVGAKDRFGLVGGSARLFEGELFLQGKPVTADTLAHALAHDAVDVILDFSTPDANAILFDAMSALPAARRVIVGTTGLGGDRIAAWIKLAAKKKHSVLIAPNTSLGVLVLARAVELAAAPLARAGFDIEVLETHHRAKRDAPSGTARFLADAVVRAAPTLKIQTAPRLGGPRPDGEVGMHSVRGGGVFGEHSVRCLGPDEEVSLSHRAYSRALFASGALTLAQWLARRPPGLQRLEDVTLEDL